MMRIYDYEEFEVKKIKIFIVFEDTIRCKTIDDEVWFLIDDVEDMLGVTADIIRKTTRNFDLHLKKKIGLKTGNSINVTYILSSRALAAICMKIRPMCDNHIEHFQYLFSMVVESLLKLAEESDVNTDLTEYILSQFPTMFSENDKYLSNNKE